MKKRKPAAKPLSKAAFVRSLPPHIPAADVVERARVAGVGPITEHYVHNVRSLERGAPRAARPPRAQKKIAPTKRTPEELLHAIALEIGVARAIAILEAEHRKARAVIDTPG